MSAFNLFDSKSFFDFDNDGKLNLFEQSEYELFTFGDGSMHEPDGVAPHLNIDDDYDIDCDDYEIDDDEYESECDSFEIIGTIALSHNSEPRSPNKPIALTEKEKEALKKQLSITDTIEKSLNP